MKTKFLRIGRGTLSFVLSFMMIVSTMLVGTVGTIDASAATAPCDIYFANTLAWTTVKAYIWGSTDASYNSESWANPTLMTQVTDTESRYYGLYKVTVYDGNVIFRDDSGKQTVDIENLSTANADQVWVPSGNTANDNKYMGNWQSIDDYFNNNNDIFIEGRFRIRESSNSESFIYSYNGQQNGWGTENTNIRLTQESETLYKLPTYCTISELSNDANGIPYFQFRLRSNGTWGSYYGLGDSDKSLPNDKNEGAGKENSIALSSGAEQRKSLYFSGSGSSSTITLWLDTSDANNYKFYYTEDTPSTKYVNNLTYGDNGTASVDKETASEGDTVTVTATPADGYTVDTVTYTYNNGTGSVTEDATTSGDNTYTYTMPAADVTVNVTFKQTVADSTPVYVEGRFRVKSSPTSSNYTYTFDSNGNWANTSTNIQFQKVEGEANLYKLETNCTVAELSTSLGTGGATSGTTYPPYLFIRYGDTNYMATEATSWNGNNSGQANAVTLSTSGSNDKLRFNGTDSVSLVVLKFNSQTKQLWYELSTTQTYTNTVAPSTNGSASVDKPTASEGDTVTVTVTPDTGYEVEAVTCTDANSSPVSVTKSGNNYTYTMPASNVTVTVTFKATSTGDNDSKIYYKKSTDGVDKDWSSVYAYLYSSSSGSNNAAWPGVAMTYNSSTGLYEYEYSSSSNFDYVIFNSGSRGSNYERRSKQTTSLTLVNEKTYSYQYDSVINEELTQTLNSSSYRLLYSQNDGISALTNSATLYVDSQNNIVAKFTVGSDDTCDLKPNTNYYFAATNDASTNGILGTSPSIDKTSANGLTVQGGENSGKHRILISASDKVTAVYVEIGYYFSESNNGLFTQDSTNQHYVIASDYTVTPTLGDPTENEVRIIAKDGTIRDNFEKFPQIADTAVTYTNGAELLTARTYSDRATEANVTKGATVTVTTTLGDSYKGAYYVKAFNINGETYGLTSQPDTTNGVYSCEFTISAETDVSVYEITPVYFYIDTTDTVTFYVENFDDEVQTAWGEDMISPVVACHAYYDGGEESTEPKNALGGYPGQPMLYENGRYFMQIPKYLDGDTSKTIKGITLNNYAWDSVHSLTQTNSRINCQTYDYDDFVELSNLTDEIIFRFKYRTTENPTITGNALAGNVPDTNNTLVQGEFENGWETLVDYYDRPTDLFGNLIQSMSSSDVLNSTDKLYIVSNGYEVNYLGDYATEWYIYDNTGNFITNLPSSVLLYQVLDDTYKDSDGKLSESNMPSDFAKLTYDGKRNRSAFWSAYVKLYNNYSSMPAIITYETAIKSAGDTTGGAVSNPGLRSDGRWYYSHSGASINAQIEIQYSNDGGTSFKDDPFPVDTYKGTTTNASAYFTNSDYYHSTSISDVAADSSNYFTFEASASSSGTDGKTYYFVGWYIKNDDGGYSLLNNNDFSTKSQVPMSTNVTLIARYVAASDTSLLISHDLYKNAVRDSDSPALHNGNGTPSLTVEIVDANDNTVKTITGTSASVNVNKTILETYKDSGYKLKITLTTQPDDGSTLEDIYRKDYSTTPVSGGYFAPSNDTTWNAGKILSNTLTYTCEISNLFNNDSLVTNSVIFYSDLSTGSFKVNFKYYDRDTSSLQHSLPATIDTDSTTFPVVVSMSSSDANDKKIENAIATAILNLKINNVIDEYTFWASQSQAESGIAGRTNYHTNSNYEATLYHTDCYGNVQTSGEKWVTYFDADNSEITENIAQADPTRVASVAVWGYNEPRQYSVTVVAPKTEGAQLSQKSALYSNVYLSDGTLTSYKGFYNQRLGVADTDEDAIAVGSNEPSTYLKNYGIKTAFLGEQVTAPQTAKDSEGNSLKFDGWYVNGVKVTSNKTYSYRISADLTVVAGYVPVDTVERVGASVTKNASDIYVDANGVERIRFNTQLNVYGCPDSDPNIQNVAAVYVRLPAKDSNGNTITWSEDNLNKLNLDEIKTHIKSSLDSSSKSSTYTVNITNVVTDGSAKVIYYSYKVTQSDTISSDQVKLTNKNRVQFTLQMKSELCKAGGSNSAVLAFAAIKYGENDSNAVWTVSDNYVSYINERDNIE